MASQNIIALPNHPFHKDEPVRHDKDDGKNER